VTAAAVIAGVLGFVLLAVAACLFGKSFLKDALRIRKRKLNKE
jgi:hypothetical protein